MSPAVCRAIAPRSTSAASGLARVWTREDRLAARDVGRRRRAPGGRSGPGRRSAGSRSCSRFEAAMTTTSSRAPKPSSSTRSWFSVWSCSRWKPPPIRARADGVELVDEDDRGRVLARLLEELADACGAEPREHLDEGRGARRVEVRARGARDRLREQRLARSRRPVEQDPSRHTRAEPLEALAVAQEVDDLLELLLRLVEAGDVVPRHLDLRPAHDRRRLRARHELHRVEQAGG